jgi:hypothetical protein
METAMAFAHSAPSLVSLCAEDGHCSDPTSTPSQQRDTKEGAECAKAMAVSILRRISIVEKAWMSDRYNDRLQLPKILEKGVDSIIQAAIEGDAFQNLRRIVLPIADLRDVFLFPNAVGEVRCRKNNPSQILERIPFNGRLDNGVQRWRISGPTSNKSTRQTSFAKWTSSLKVCLVPFTTSINCVIEKKTA